MRAVLRSKQASKLKQCSQTLFKLTELYFKSSKDPKDSKDVRYDELSSGEMCINEAQGIKNSIPFDWMVEVFSLDISL